MIYYYKTDAVITNIIIYFLYVVGIGSAVAPRRRTPLAQRQIYPAAQRQIYPAYYYWWLMNLNRAKPKSEEVDEDQIIRCEDCSPTCHVRSLSDNKMLM